MRVSSASYGRTSSVSTMPKASRRPATSTTGTSAPRASTASKVANPVKDTLDLAGKAMYRTAELKYEASRLNLDEAKAKERIVTLVTQISHT